jgi:hypothetical protein
MHFLKLSKSTLSLFFSTSKRFSKHAHENKNCTAYMPPIAPAFNITVVSLRFKEHTGQSIRSHGSCIIVRVMSTRMNATYVSMASFVLFVTGKQPSVGCFHKCKQVSGSLLGTSRKMHYNIRLMEDKKEADILMSKIPRLSNITCHLVLKRRRMRIDEPKYR